MILPFMLKSFKVTNLSIVDVSKEAKITNNSFVIKSLDYITDKNVLYITYKLKEESGRTQNLKSMYILRYLDGEKIAEGKQNIILEAGKEGIYKATLISPYNIKGFLKLTLTVSNNNGSQWIVKNVDNSKSYITALPISNNPKKTGLTALILIILASFIYLAATYLYRYNARTKNNFPGIKKKTFIPLDLNKKKK